MSFLSVGWSIGVDVGLLLLQHRRYENNAWHRFVFESEYWHTMSGFSIWPIPIGCMEVHRRTQRQNRIGLLHGRRCKWHRLNHTMGHQFRSLQRSSEIGWNCKFRRWHRRSVFCTCLQRIGGNLNIWNRIVWPTNMLSDSFNFQQNT